MLITILLFTALVYLILGTLFILPFYTKGIHLIDDGIKGSSVGFYIIIVPGVIVFWCVLLHKWIIAVKQNKHE